MGLIDASSKGFTYATCIALVIFVTDLGYWGCKDNMKKLFRFYIMLSSLFTTYFYMQSGAGGEAQIPVPDVPPEEPPIDDCPPPGDPQDPPQTPPPVNCPPRPVAPDPSEPNCVVCGFNHPEKFHAW